MRGMRNLVFLLLLLGCGGCLRSLHPLYTDKDLLFAPGLVGRWAEADSTAIWDFSPSGDNAYQLVYTDEHGNAAAFQAHLLNLRGHKFMDLYPKDSGQGNDFYRIHFVPVHTFFFVRQIEPVLQLSAPEDDWLKELLAREPQSIAHEILDGEVVLTAKTPELQALLIRMADAPGAFGEFSMLRRLDGGTGDPR